MEPRSGKISVIVPCYNEEAGIELTIKTLQEKMSLIATPYELLLVDDGSKDSTFRIIEKCAEFDPVHIFGISFSRNFGKEAAIMAGLQAANGDCIVVIDSDLQHPPEVIAQMYQKWQEGYDIVEGVKSKRQKESLAHRLFAKGFYGIFNRAIGMDIGNASDFKLLDARVAKVLCELPERETFFRGLTFWTGFNMTVVEYEVRSRTIGKTKWSFFKLLKYAIHNVTSFTSLPLSIIGYISVIMLVLSFIFTVRALRLYLAGLAAGGITTVVILILLVGGLILLAISVMGQYIANIYEEVKGRPRYLVEKTTIRMKEK